MAIPQRKDEQPKFNSRPQKKQKAEKTEAEKAERRLQVVSEKLEIHQKLFERVGDETDQLNQKNDVELRLEKKEFIHPEEAQEELEQFDRAVEAAIARWDRYELLKKFTGIELEALLRPGEEFLEFTKLDPSNYEGIRSLKDRAERLLKIYLQDVEIFGDGIFLKLLRLLGSSVGSPQFPTEKTVEREVQKLNQIIHTMERLLHAFSPNKSIVITPRLEVIGHGTLDLLVRFTEPPNKATFGIALRSQGEAKILYNESKENFYIRRGSKGFRAWNPNQIDQLGEQEVWLKRYQLKAFGESARDRNRPMIKLLVLTGNTKVGQHSPHLYTSIGNQQFLRVKKRSTVFVMEEDQLIFFLENWFK